MALPITLALPLTVVFGSDRVRLPVDLLIVGVFRPPLFPTVADPLCIQRIRLDLLPVVISPAAALALRLAAHALLQAVGRGLECSLAVWTAASRDQ